MNETYKQQWSVRDTTNKRRKEEGKEGMKTDGIRVPGEMAPNELFFLPVSTSPSVERVAERPQ